MRNTWDRRWMAMMLAAFGLVGCGEQSPDIAPTPTFPNGTGQLERGGTPIEYVAGPYGLGANSTIPNLDFIGFPNAKQSHEAMRPIQLADFYNPTGAEVYPEGSIYGGGNPKPKALVIDVSAVWCFPCNDEADKILPEKYLQYKPLGGEILLVLGDGPTSGIPAGPKDLYQWDLKYSVDYPSVIDPGTKILVDGFPTNFIVRTKDMRILRVGSPDDAFWMKFEQVLTE
ncbi:MAG TPA: TlpA family protein disulfide reductase [Polyangium sp.]|nr:TlpA family protein disulfide reductase [Polyangium sp.]